MSYILINGSKSTGSKTLTWSIHRDTLVWPLWTLAIEAVAQTSLTRETIHREDVLGTSGPLPVTVFCQVTFILLATTLLAPRQNLCGGFTVNLISWLLYRKRVMLLNVPAPVLEYDAFTVASFGCCNIPTNPLEGCVESHVSDKGGFHVKTYSWKVNSSGCSRSSTYLSYVLTLQLLQHSPSAHWEPPFKEQVVALQHGLVQSCRGRATRFTSPLIFSCLSLISQLKNKCT